MLIFHRTRLVGSAVERRKQLLAGKRRPARDEDAANSSLGNDSTIWRGKATRSAREARERAREEDYRRSVGTAGKGMSNANITRRLF